MTYSWSRRRGTTGHVSVTPRVKYFKKSADIHILRAVNKYGTT